MNFKTTKIVETEFTNRYKAKNCKVMILSQVEYLENLLLGENAVLETWKILTKEKF